MLWITEDLFRRVEKSFAGWRWRDRNVTLRYNL